MTNKPAMRVFKIESDFSAVGKSFFECPLPLAPNIFILKVGKIYFSTVLNCYRLLKKKLMRKTSRKRMQKFLRKKLKPKTHRKIMKIFLKKKLKKKTARKSTH